MLDKDFELECLEDSPKYQQLNKFEKEELICTIKTDINLVVEKYNFFECLQSPDIVFDKKRLLSFCQNNILSFFETLNKYDFDLVVNFLYSNNNILSENVVDELFKKNKKLSFVTRELLFNTEAIELSIINDKQFFAKSFNFEKIVLELTEKPTEKPKTEKK